MKRRHLPAAPAVILALLALSLGSLPSVSRAGELSYPYEGRPNYSVDGSVRSVDSLGDHLTVSGDDSRTYIIDTYGSYILLRGAGRAGAVSDLRRGMRVTVNGTLVGGNLLEADSVRVQPNLPPAETTALPVAPLQIDGVVRDTDLDRGRMTIADADGNRAVIDTVDAAIRLSGGVPGRLSDMARGMRVVVEGTSLPGGVIVADRVRVVSDDFPPVTPAPVPAPALPSIPAPAVILPSGTAIPPSPDPAAVMASLDTYTGIIIDARYLPTISRSPAPAIYGPDPGTTLLYPDRSHVPTPDEVQDESIVRYYHTEAEACAGVAGSNPLILPAQAVLTPAQDALQLNASDMTLLIALDKKLGFSRNWKVAFLIPGNQ